MITIFISGFIVLATMFMSFLLRKRILHLNLLKQLFPNKLQKVTLLTSLCFVESKNNIPFEYIFWLYVPVYYDMRIMKEKKDVNINLLQKKLKQNNRFILYVLLTIVVWIYVLGPLLNN